ncbi:MAG: hypothetical protein LBQ84_00320 [Flavobacteriaceae bacterium]|jgi:hypothetical protein|nr:hypothetical protein [Flavobacteriaceae bacterium]
MNSKIIAIDFDGTIVEDKYPEIGRPLIFAFDTMRKLQGRGYRLVLWTYRQGKRLDEAVEFCKKNGIEFYAVNASFEGEVFEIESQSRKIHADYFIDDRNLGGFPGWGEVYEIIKEKIEFGIEGRQVIPYSKRRHKKKGFFSRIFKS